MSYTCKEKLLDTFSQSLIVFGYVTKGSDKLRHIGTKWTLKNSTGPNTCTHCINNYLEIYYNPRQK